MKLGDMFNVRKLPNGGYVVENIAVHRDQCQQEIAAFTNAEEFVQWLRDSILDEPTATAHAVSPLTDLVKELMILGGRGPGKTTHPDKYYDLNAHGVLLQKIYLALWGNTP